MPTMKPISALIIRVLAILLLTACPRLASAQSYTLTPTPFQTAFDNSGHIINNACIWTYVAGTTTAVSTYSDNAGTANTNPIRADSAGRFTVFLLAGSSYKFVYESSCLPPAHGTTLRTADNIAGTPASASNVDVQGVAGETLSAGFCTYLSDGSGGKTAGQWFKCDSANTYSSLTPEIGMAVSAIPTSATGTIRLAGSVMGLSSLSVGSEYFVGTAGAITSTAPTNSRHLGHADTASSLVLTADPAPPVSSKGTGWACGRLTLTTGLPVTVVDVTAATTLYYTATWGCNQVTLWNGTANQTDTLTEANVAVPATTSQMYDVFAFDNAGMVNIEVLAWTNDTTRATAITLQNGYLAKSGTPTRRYVGSFRTTTVSGQTEDSVAKRYVWNFYNRASRPLQRVEATSTWAYSTSTIRQANGAAANQVDIVVGVADTRLDLLLNVNVDNTASGSASAGIGEDSTTTYTSAAVGIFSPNSSGVSVGIPGSCRLVKYPAIGHHFYSWNEWGNGSTTNWYGAVSLGGTVSSGLFGFIEG